MGSGDNVIDLATAPAATRRPRQERVRFNPFSEQFRNDPYAVYRALRREDPMHRVMGMWVLTRYADVAAVLRDRRFSSKLIPNGIRLRKPPSAARDADLDPIEGFIAKAIVFTENPDHARLRKLVNDCFTSKAIEAERAHIEAIVDGLIDKKMAGGGMEAIADFADLIPLRVTADRLGLPEESDAQIRAWTHAIRFLLDPGMMTPDDYGRVDAALIKFMEYLRPLLAVRRADPGPDIMSRLLANRSDDDKLSDDEVILTCIMSFVAGHETTMYLIGNGLLALIQHPEQYDRLRREPSLLANAVDEILRFEAPLQQTKRIALEDVELGGELVRRGDTVLVCLGAANRDPAQFTDPDAFDIARPAIAHLSLGYGMRACLGGALAHIEAQVALGRMCQRFERLELVGDRVTWQNHSRILRGLEQLPIRVAAAVGG